ncbi:glucan ABC transporter ATP-binding protein/ permease [Alcaligenaceae bacterium LF4-65]|uniref:Glucan ABC transporter ATP-binding protein/ permease n=1 Tax=Zwartia hollandica TaxID=324606 RepID=A0A953N9Q4_9BURK|nr:glucan ABC transporter ATP-binding protein/ permease [Zwartia hollandica]MBZ1350563.1 glucan ABC transporter ATP-binding protein/ permease [Zwartia hollandica]
MTLTALYKRVLRQLGSDQRTGWGLAITNVCLAITLFAEPILFGRVIDTLSKSATQSNAQLWDRVVPLLLAWAGFGLFTIAAGASIALLSDRLAHRRRHAVLADYFEHVLHLPLSQHSRTHSGRAMKVMLQGTDTLWWLWLSFFRDNLAALVSLIVLIPVALYINWRLAWVLIVLCVIFALLTHFILKRTQTLQQQVESHHSDLAERASDTLGNVALVQSFARVQYEVDSLRGISQRVLGAQLPVLSWWAVMTMLTRSATTLTILCIVVLGAWLFTQDLISVGEIVTFIAFAGLVIGKLEQVVSFINKLAMDAPKLREFFQVLDTNPLICDSATAIDPGRLNGKIVFKDVSFSYDGKRTAIDNLNFTIQPGQTIALVGASGAGKTTALSLLYRAFDPQTGVIAVDDQDIRHFQLAALRRNIGVVFQEPLLFNRSIAENLRIGSPEATDAQLLEACARAQALEFIERQPHGLETNIGERGRALSGGERQRLSIARVILKDPPILILDEATSALDGTTELKLMEALEEVTRNRTTLVIAHRLSTIRHADMILVMEDGRVIETGSFDALYARHGRFTEIVNAQFNEQTSKSPV